MDTEPTTPPPTGLGGGGGHVPMLDGIRAFAVLGVMAYHAGVLVGRGGFFGVDTFFTLSGFLITTLLVGEWDRTGGIVLRSFWMRRAKRLLPALFLMLATVAVYNAVANSSSTWPTLGSDEISSLLYVANWHFIAAGTDYFAQTTMSPVNHTWSLAIEEQFYLVWPVVVLACMRLRRGRSTLLALAVVGSVGSAVEMALLYRPSDVSRVYYGTDTRAQSLLIGVALALVLALVPSTRPVPGGSRTSGPRRALGLHLLGWAGVAGSAAIWVDLGYTSPLTYRGGFALSGCATSAVIASVILAPRSKLSAFLAWSPLQYLGRISYGMYLWHYPLFLVLDGQRTGLTGYPLFLVRSAITIAMASASYHWLEQPIRRLRRPRVSQKVLVGAGGLAAASVVVAFGLPSSGRPAAADTTYPGSGRGAATAPPLTVSGNQPRVLIVGDSLAKTLGNGVSGEEQFFSGTKQLLTGGLATVGPYFGLDIVNGGTVNCALTSGTYRVHGSPETPFGSCDARPGQPVRPADWSALIREVKPQVTLFVARLDITDHLFHGRWTHIGNGAFDAYLMGQMQAAVRVLTAAGGRVVFLTTPYFSTGEQPSGQAWPEDDPARVDAYNAMLRRVASMHPGVVSVFDLNGIMDAGHKPLSTIAGVRVRYSDGIHFTPVGDCWLAPRILAFVESVLGRPPGLKEPTSVPPSACTDVPVTTSF